MNEPLANAHAILLARDTIDRGPSQRMSKNVFPSGFIRSWYVPACEGVDQRHSGKGGTVMLYATRDGLRFDVPPRLLFMVGCLSVAAVVVGHGGLYHRLAAAIVCEKQ